jgi:hypothetical protein
MRKAIRRNPDIAPPLLSPTGEIAENSATMGDKMAPAATDDERDAITALQMTVGATPSAADATANSESSAHEAPPKKIRVKNLQGKTVVARSIVVGGIGITCALEHCGKHRPAAFTDAGIVYINTDHPLYKKQTERGQEMLGFFLTYLLSQQVALLLSEGDTRKAFDTQNRLLTDSW